MSWRQIFCALRSGRLTVTFLVLETVLACAFICNALFFIVHQAGPMLAPTGVAAGQVLVVDKIMNPFPASVSLGELRTLETRIHELRGVTAVSVVMFDQIPYGDEGVARHYRARGRSKAISVSTYAGDNLIDAFGLTLVKGRNFSPTELAVGHWTLSSTTSEYAHPHVAIITQSLARQLFPTGHALGHRTYTGKSGTTPGPVVVGIVRRMPSYQPAITSNPDASVFVPKIVTGSTTPALVVRVDPSERAQVAKVLPGVIAHIIPLQAHAKLPRVRTFESLHAYYFWPNRAKTWLMLGVTLAVLVINVICIAGLTGFWVQRRTREIGIRRALGARRDTILRYFLTENLVVIGAGAILGVIAAYAGNLWLMSHLELARLPWWWLPIGSVLLCVLGQLSALIPAVRAARVPPVVATRGLRRPRAN